MDVDHDVNLYAAEKPESPTSSQGRDEHVDDFVFDLQLCVSLLHFVNEQMTSLRIETMNDYICKLVTEERARTTLEQDMRRQQAEIRRLSTLRRQSRMRI
jgi:hypothetical protein